jgi:DNA-binding transcriptional LysR family regulator
LGELIDGIVLPPAFINDCDLFASGWLFAPVARNHPTALRDDQEVTPSLSQARTRLFAQHGLTANTYMELGSSEASKQAVMASLGISVLSRHNLRLELDSGLITVLDVEHFPLVRQWYAARVGRMSRHLFAGVIRRMPPTNAELTQTVPAVYAVGTIGVKQ